MTSTTITDAAHRCLTSFDAISQFAAPHVPGSIPSEDARSRYHIWASNLGSLHPETDRRSADYRLREAPEVVERIVELLEELAEINSDILEIVSGSRINRQISESEDDFESSNELSELNLSVGDIITSLFKVSMLVKKATTRDRYAKAASAKDAAFLAEFDIRHVADKYPKLRTQPWLLERLGNAITQRRQFLRYCRNHKHRIAHEQLALFAIPPEVERNVESGSDHGRSKADPQESVQFMTRWQNLLDISDIQDSPEDAQYSTATDALPFGESVSGDHVSSSKPDDHSATKDMATGDPSIYMPAEGIFPSILPGDIVYIPQTTNEQLSYKKGVYLGRNKDNNHTARDWSSQSEVEVSLTTLVRKTDCTTEEKNEAALLREHHSPGEGETQPRHYRKNHLLSSQACDTLLFEATQLAGGVRDITGYDEALVKPIFSNFAQRFSERNTTNGVRLEDIVRMFYATATSEQSKDATSSDAMWKADVERSAALLMKVLIEIAEDQYNFDKDVVAQLRSEQAQMIIRANEAVGLASGTYFRQSFTDRQSTFDDAEGNKLEIDSPTLKALKLRLQGIATGQEQLPGFVEENVKRTFKTFSQFMEALPVAGTSLVEDIVRDFRRCAIHELNNTLDREGKNAVVRKQEALLLSLLISVDARVQIELHGSAPRIRSRFTTILMEERARLSFSASRSEALSGRRDLQTGTNAAEDRPRDPSGSKLVSGLPIQANTTDTNVTTKTTTTTNVNWSQNFCLVCDKQCEGVYCSQACRLADLSKATQSIFSPAYSDVAHRASAPGGEALGQYFSERTDKYMNLYRREQPLPKSTSDSLESLPNPWEHLHSSSNTSLARVRRTPQEEQPAQTEQSITRPALGTRPGPTTAQWDGMQEVLQYICNYRNEDGSIPSKWFHHRVNEHIIPDYYEIIKEPMDLSKIKQKIEARAYQTVDEVVYDFALIPFNAQLFNPPGSGAYNDALIIERELRKQLPRLAAIGVKEAEDSTLPNLGDVPNNDRTSDRSDRLDRSTSESLPAMDASKRSLRERLDNAGKARQSSSRTSFPKVNQTPLEDLEPESVAKICYTCRHRFTRTANVEEGACPKCGSEFVFTDFPWNTASNVRVADRSEKQESGPALHPLGIAPPQLFDLIHDIEDVAAKLQGLQDRHSKNTNDVPEAVDQLFCLSDGFKRLSRLQENSDYRLRLQRVQENVHVLCSSVRYTVATALSSLRSPLDETQWMALSSSMRYIEHTDLLERLRWYQAAILGLLDHLGGFVSESLLGMDTNIRSLLERQAMSRRSRPAETIPVPSGKKREPSLETSTSNTCYTCQANLPDHPESKAGICQGCGSWFISNPGAPSEDVETKEAEPANPNTKSGNTDLDQPGDQSSTAQQLARLVASTSRAIKIVQILQIHHSRDATIIPEITEDLQSLLTSFQKLFQLHEDPHYEPNFVKVQEPIQVLCRSTQHTLDAMLQVLTAEPQSDETILMQLTMLTMRMTAEEKVGLPERLRWYSASVLGLLNHLDGFPSAGRIFQWLGMDEKVRSLLERQEGTRG
ncbi:hypothetical protein MBLNU13_g07860t1 [Cladosporium sp. NU13]